MKLPTKKVLLILAGSLAALIIVLIFSALLVLQSGWFANFAKSKLIALTDESTGGTAEVGGVEIDPWHLTVRIRNFVLHGTEPKSVDPLVRVPLLAARIKLFSGWEHIAGLSYLGLENPEVDVITFPNGTTNIPHPNKPSSPNSPNSTLQTIVDLAVNQFNLQKGLAEFADQKASFSARGENLHILLNYDFAKPGYHGNVSIEPLQLGSEGRPPLNASVNIPITIESNAIRLTDVQVKTPQSQISLTTALENVNAPVISARLSTSVSLPEIQRSMNMPIDANTPGAPKTLVAELAMQLNESSKTLNLEAAHIALGRSTLQALGELAPGKSTAVSFSADLALDQLSRLLKVSSVEINGDLLANGTAKLDANDHYSINGALNARGLSLRNGGVQVANVSLQSPFHADPYLVSLDGVKLRALGGDLAAKIFIEKLQQASVEATLRDLSLPVLAAVFTGKQLGYDGIIDGSLKARADFKAKGMTGYNAETKLDIVPGHHGTPVSGHVYLSYAGATGQLNLGNSYLALPNSRIDLSGSLNRRLDIDLVSHNLNDFLPAEAFASSKPVGPLPVALHGGSASARAEVSGRLSAPQIAGRVEMTKFSIQKRMFDQFAADLTASGGGVSVQNGLLTGKALRANFDASIGLSNWKPTPKSPIGANLTIRNGDIADLLALSGSLSIPATGQLSADVHINGTYGDPLGTASFQAVNGSVYEQPFSRLSSGIRLSDELIIISDLELDTAGGRVTASGSFRHPRDSFTTGHAQLQLATANLQLADLEPLQKRSPGAGGTIAMKANAAADLSKAGAQTQFALDNVSADLSATGLRVQNQSAGNLTATVRSNSGAMTYNVTSDFAGSNIQVNGRTTLREDYPTTADALVRNLSVGKALQITGQTDIPVKGTLSATAHVNGTLQAPAANLTFTLIHAEAYQERLSSLEGSIAYSNTMVRIPSLKLEAPAGSLTLSGSFDHQPNNFNSGSLNLKLDSTDLQLGEITHIKQMKEGLAGTLHLTANVSATLSERNNARRVSVSMLTADVAANGLRVDNRSLGKAAFQARTEGHTVRFALDSDIAGSRIHGSGVSQLSGDYQTQATLSFGNVRYTNIAPFISAAGNTPPATAAFDASTEGQVSIDGPLLDPDRLTGRLQLSRLDVRTNPQKTPTGAPPLRAVDLRNEGPIIVSLSKSVIHVDELRISGPDTNITASGAINLKEGTNPLGLRVAADVDLALLQDADRDFYSSGAVSLDAAVRGNFVQPLVNGKIVLKNANVNYTLSPNGLSNANGTILLNGTSANIQTLTAESGGGKISITGVVGYGPVMNFDLRATANKVRVRYSGASVTSNASISLIGSARRSLLRGTVTVQRVVYNSSSDIGSLLSSASAPPSTPTAPSSFLSGMRLDIRIVTASDLRVSSSYANRLEIFADMTLRGTAAIPGMLGRVRVTNGQLVFFGNTYTVSTGTVNFYNPNEIEPVLDISLETVAQGVSVTIGVSGTMDDLNLSYRSDPPLTFQQIVQLLATNTTPANPVIAAHQPAPAQQSFSQMGESAILGQAIANPLASRVQRVFGLSQFKIDPSVAGNNGQPTARVTLQQKVASNITFTYITDVTETNSEIIRVEWDFTGKLSAVGMRDFNGNVSVQFFYKFNKR